MRLSIATAATSWRWNHSTVASLGPGRSDGVLEALAAEERSDVAGAQQHTSPGSRVTRASSTAASRSSAVSDVSRDELIDAVHSGDVEQHAPRDE